MAKTARDALYIAGVTLLALSALDMLEYLRFLASLSWR